MIKENCFWRQRVKQPLTYTLTLYSLGVIKYIIYFNREPHMPKQESPARVLRSALKAARRGEMPTFDTRGLLHMLSLDTAKADGLPILDRMIGKVGGVRDILAAGSVKGLTRQLIEATNNHTSNPAQEEIAHALGAAVTIQIVREGDICPGATELALSSTRPDIIDPRVQKLAALSQFFGTVLPLAELRLMGETPPEAPAGGPAPSA
jgi:hypothetical protein